jgi:hypothetical protein
MNIIVAPVHAVGEYGDTMSCDYVIDSADCLRVRVRKLHRIFTALAKKVSTVADIRIWNSSVHVVSRAVVVDLVGDDRMEQTIDMSGVPAILKDVASIRFDAACDNYERVEAMMLHVNEDGVSWSFYPKHTSVQCETEVIAYANLEADPAKK